MPKLVIFDLDGTLTPSKSPLEPEMAEVLCRLLAVKKVLVIGGGSPKQFFDQFLNHLSCPPEALDNLYIMPTSGAVLFRHQGDSWERVYEYQLTDAEKAQILVALNEALKETDYVRPETPYGEIIEDRKSQISFSGLGQKAPLELKSAWDPDQKRRLPIVEKLKHSLPGFDVKLGGTTTIDITKKGINKAFGVMEISKLLNLPISDAVYIGDALYENGNDAIVKESGVETIQISGPVETAKIINDIINQS